MDHASLTFLPLGGLGEVGMNCFCLETEGDLLVVDCGVSFPGRVHGVDLVHPKLDHVFEHQDRLRAIILTHGHEDHVGAVPYLLRGLRRTVPIYGTRYALAMVQRRLDEHADVGPVTFHALTPGRHQRIGAFELEPVRVNHSIPDAVAIVYRTAAGTVVHTGDFKIEERPLDGEAFGADALRAAGDEGVDLLLSDSTNIDVEGTSGEEADVAVRLEELARQAEGRFVVALFASNVYRMKAVAAAARATGRKICLLGRSLQTHSEVARELGLVPELAGLLVSNDEIRQVPRDRLCVLATGSQGEPPAALSRLAAGVHPSLALDPGDTVVLSSRIIPGNEKIVFDMLDRLERLGCHVIHRRTDERVHVSGHAAREEQRQFLRLCRPRTFVPVHGTFHHLRRHAELAREEGVAQAIVVENGARVVLQDAHLEVAGTIETGIVHVDRGQVVDPGQLRDRELLGEFGHAVVSFTVDARARYAGTLDVIQRGFLRPDEEDAILDEAVRFLDDDLRRAREDDLDAMEDRARRGLKRFFAKRLGGRKPLVTAVALEVTRG